MRHRNTFGPAAAAIMVSLVTLPATGDRNVLELFVGQWDVHIDTLRPEPSTTRYSETYTWVLDRQFIRGETEGKDDGSQDIIFGTYDAQANGYPFWIFSSTGTYLHLPPGKWNARQRVMEWENPDGLDIHYRSRCHFPDRDTRTCTLIVKDWKGKVLLETEWRAERHGN